MIAGVAPAELSNPRPDLQLLQAAGEIQRARGRLVEANKYLRHSLAVNARNTEATLSLAQLMIDRDDPEGARAMFERAAALEPTSVFATSELARSEQEGWNLPRVIGVMVKACQAIGYAHAKAVIHRDLKPANIMVGRFGEVYVMDWGLARVSGKKESLRKTWIISSNSMLIFQA